MLCHRLSETGLWRLTGSIDLLRWLIFTSGTKLARPWKAITWTFVLVSILKYNPNVKSSSSIYLKFHELSFQSFYSSTTSFPFPIMLGPKWGATNRLNSTAWPDQPRIDPGSTAPKRSTNCAIWGGKYLCSSSDIRYDGPGGEASMNWTWIQSNCFGNRFLKLLTEWLGPLFSQLTSMKSLNLPSEWLGSHVYLEILQLNNGKAGA